MMKRMLLLMCLLLSLSLAAPASAATADILGHDMLGESTYVYVSSMTAVDGTLWALLETNVGLRLAWWQEGMTEAEMASTVMENGRYLMTGTEITDQNRYAPSVLFTDGERLMSLNTATGVIFAITVEAGEAVFTEVVAMTDVTPLYQMDGDEPTDLRNVTDTAVMDGVLYWLTRDWNNAGREENFLFAIDLTSGAYTSVPCEHVVAIEPYKDGKMLAVVHDQANSYDAKTQTVINPDLAVLDPATGALTVQRRFDVVMVDDMAYAAGLDTVIYFDNSRVMGMPGLGAPVQYGYAPSNFAEHLLVLDENTFVLGDYEGVKVRPMSSSFGTDKHLNLYNAYLDDGIRLFNERHPEIPVYYSREYYDDVEKLNQAMLSGENALDVLQMGISYSSFLDLRDKGYCADLSGDETLMAMAEQLHPVFRDAVMKDGKLYAVPLRAYSFGWGYNPEVLQEMDFDPNLIPTNLIDLCDLITEWNDGLMDDYPEYCLLEGVTNTREWMFNSMMDSYMVWAGMQGEDVSFDTPVFRQLMEALENMRCDEMDRIYAQDELSGEVYRMGLIGVGYQMVGDFTWLIDGYNTWVEIIPMQLTPDVPFFTEVSLEVAFINPRSSHMEEALELLRCRMEGMGEEDRHTLFMNETEPVLNPYFADTMAQYEAEMAIYTAQMANASEAEKPFIQDAINGLQEMIDMQETFRYVISEESIHRYQTEVVPTMTLAKPSPFNSEQNSGSGELTTLMNRYRDGQIGLEQFIREADNKLWMMRMENQ